jgi:capsular polysaccharide transport system ATP-binding protein
MTISLSHVNKRYKTRTGERVVLDNVSLQINPGEKIGILGRNGAGKSTLIRIISGAERPTSGTISRSMTVSWPLAFGGAFQGSLTGLDNLRFICRIYGADIARAKTFAEEFSELGAYMREPVKKYSSGMRARLAFALSMAIDFDCFLIDEVIAVGDSRFHAKCEEELFNRRGDKAMIIVSHDPHYIRTHCDHAYTLSQGKINTFASIDQAFDSYNANQVI